MKVVEEADRDSNKTPESNEWETSEAQKKVRNLGEPVTNNKHCHVELQGFGFEKRFNRFLYSFNFFVFFLQQLFALLGGQTNPASSDVNVNWLLDRLGSTMPSAGNSTSATPANIPSNEECGIRDVWAHNLDEEFKTIRQIVQKYHWIAMVNNFYCQNDIKP